MALKKKKPAKKKLATKTKRKKSKSVEVIEKEHFHYLGNVNLKKSVDSEVEMLSTSDNVMAVKGENHAPATSNGISIKYEGNLPECCCKNSIIYKFNVYDKYQFHPNRALQIGSPTKIRIPECHTYVVELEGNLSERGIVCNAIVKDGIIVDLMIYNCGKTVVIFDNDEVIAKVRFTPVSTISLLETM